MSLNTNENSLVYKLAFVIGFPGYFYALAELVTYTTKAI
jgi:hypothetical protein